jgi:uncharacterized membrane protein YgdD (TMEM256/DUF423 family)
MANRDGRWAGWRPWLLLGAANGAIAVGLGAHGAHGLEVPPEQAAIYGTAVRYQMWHALALLAVAAMAAAAPSRGARLLRISGILFSFGIIIFCGSLYAIGLFDVTPLPVLPPAGGAMLIGGWLALAAVAFTRGDE